MEMPKSRRELLEEIHPGEGLPITQTERHSWQSTVTAINKKLGKKFTIRTDPSTKEIRVWKLKLKIE
jgi:hypothetical protein